MPRNKKRKECALRAARCLLMKRAKSSLCLTRDGGGDG